MTGFTFDDILAVLPHRAPLLLVERVIKLAPGVMIVTEHDINPIEPWFAGHFPGNPLLPGVITTDALAQTCGLLLGLSARVAGDTGLKGSMLFMLAAADMKYTSPAFPGETLRMTAWADKAFGKLSTYKVEAVVKRKLIAAGAITLAQSG